MAPYQLHPGFGGHTWIFEPILREAVQRMSIDNFSIEELLTLIKHIFQQEL